MKDVENNRNLTVPWQVKQVDNSPCQHHKDRQGFRDATKNYLNVDVAQPQFEM